MAEFAVTYTVDLDFDRDGVYDTDIAAYVDHEGGGIRISREFDEDGIYRIAKVEIALRNQDGRFTPDYRSGPYRGKLRKQVGIRITGTLNGTDYAVFTGYTDQWKVDRRKRRASLSCTCYVGLLADAPVINVQGSTSRTTSDAFLAVATAMGLSADDYDIEPGIQDLPLHYVAQQQPLDALMDVAESEIPGHVWVDANGGLRFQNRHSWIGPGVDHTWGDGTGIRPEAVTYDYETRHVIGEVSVQANVFVSDEPGSVVMAFSRNEKNGNSVLIPAGTTKDYGFLPYGRAVLAAITPVADTDYRGNTAADGSGTDATSSLTLTFVDYGSGCTLKVQNTSGSDVYHTWQQVRGTPYSTVLDRPVFTVSKATAGEVVRPGAAVSLPFPDDSTSIAKDYAWHLLYANRHEYPVAELDFAWDSEAIAAAMLAVDLANRVAFADKATGNDAWLTGLDDWWIVVGIEHKLRPLDVSRSTIRLVPTWLFRNIDRIGYDDFLRTAAVGALGTSLSGHAWADDSGVDLTGTTARANTNSLCTPHFNLGLGATDQAFETSYASIGAGDEVGMVLRWIDSNNYLRVYLDAGSNKYIAEQVVGGVTTELASPAFTVGVAHDIWAFVQGSRLRAYVDGELLIDVYTVPAALTTGTHVGLMFRNASGTAEAGECYGEALNAGGDAPPLDANIIGDELRALFGEPDAPIAALTAAAEVR